MILSAAVHYEHPAVGNGFITPDIRRVARDVRPIPGGDKMQPASPGWGRCSGAGLLPVCRSSNDGGREPVFKKGYGGGHCLGMADVDHCSMSSPQLTAFHHLAQYYTGPGL